MMSYDYPHPVSRTYQYKKITKPLLERKRRARINRCLDELKDLMVDALETEGENISKLEKADILELTVRHLQRLQASRPSGLSTSAVPGEDTSESRWRSGFGHCAAEACRFLAALPGEAADRLARHLASGLQVTRQLEVQVPQKSNSSPPLSPMTVRSALESPTLGILEKTANLLVPTPPITDGGTQSRGNSLSPRPSIHPYSGPRNNVTDRVLPTQCKTVGSSRSNTNDLPSSFETPTTLPKIDVPTIGNKSSELGSVDKSKPTNGQTVTDDDEEIDVENLDESDPMWRPW